MADAVSLVVSVGKSIASKAVGCVVGKILEKLKTHRAQQFFDAFAETIEYHSRTGLGSTEITEQLSELIENDVNSELVFDAYRRVCLAASKNIGPRIIGILTARIINDARQSDAEEDAIFRAAELLSDSNLVEFRDHYRKCLVGPVKANQYGRIELEGYQSDIDINASRKEIEAGPCDLRELLGEFAPLLEQVGLISTRLSFSPFHTESTSTLGFRSYYTFERPCSKLAELIDLAEKGSQY